MDSLQGKDKKCKLVTLGKGEPGKGFEERSSIVCSISEEHHNFSSCVLDGRGGVKLVREVRGRG